MSVLVIVDMQETFRHSAEQCLPGAVRLIKKAKKQSHPIVLLEIHPGPTSKTIPEVFSLIENYEKHHVASKYTGDGSPQVQLILEKESLNPDVIHVCGVYSNACVKETAVGLSLRFPKSKIVLYFEACCGTCADMKTPYHENYDWKWLLDPAQNPNFNSNIYFSRNKRVIAPRKAAA